MTDIAPGARRSRTTPPSWRLSPLDRFLPVWILLAMAGGLLLGRLVPGVQSALDAVKVGQTSLPIALGLLLMMYPVLAKVRYEDMSHVTGDRRLLWLSLLLNWVIGPLLMFTLAWVFLADQPEFRTGLIVIGLARCIAMVLIWNDLACGDREAAALLVAINSVFQILAYALLGTFYLKILPGWLGLDTQDVQFSTWEITKAVLIFLGIPLVAGYLTRRIGTAHQGPRLVRADVHPVHQPVRALRPAVHDRGHVRAAGRGHHRPTRSPSFASPSRCSSTSRIMWGVSFVAGRAQPLGLPQDGDARLHRRGQQLRARDRRQHRRLGRHLRPGARRRHRPAHRGARSRRPRLRVAVAAPEVLQPQRGRPLTADRNGMTTFVLLHGAWHGAWCWTPLQRHLTAMGARSVAMDLPADEPAAGIERYADVACQAVPEDDDVVIVAHSLAGLVAPIVADRVGARGLLMVAALWPHPGRSAREQARELPGIYTEAYWQAPVVRHDDGSTSMPPDAATPPPLRGLRS